jgi:AcrR family transcriptional regulator
MRDDILDAALLELELTGWRGLRMSEVATRAGVSRQTVYNTFSNRSELAKAMVDRLTDHFLAGVEAAFMRDGTIFEHWLAGVGYALHEGTRNAALHAMLAAGDDEHFLDLLTRGADPVVQTARTRVSAAALRSHPDLDPERARIAAEATARLVISSIMLPLHPPDQTAYHIAVMVTAMLEAPGTWQRNGRTSRATAASRSGPE